MFVIFGWLEAQQREPESILAAGLAVAAARVATELGKNGHDLIWEIDRDRGVEFLHDNRQRGDQPLGVFHGDGCFAVSERRDEPVRIDAHDAVWRNMVTDLACVIA